MTFQRKTKRNRWRKRIARLPIPIKRLLFAGAARHCPVCNSHVRKFYDYGHPPRQNAWCPVCGCVERHRMDLLFFQQRTTLFDANPKPKRMLHIAPEPAMQRAFEKIPNLDYLSGDLSRPVAMMKMDITSLPFAAASFDVIYCSHVLEHVPDDRRAMHEFHRVLKPHGLALLQVPITAKKTLEDPTVTTPDDRQRLYGQWDHVRRYGPDYADRLNNAGFNVQTIKPADLIDTQQHHHLGIVDRLTVFCCHK